MNQQNISTEIFTFSLVFSFGRAKMRFGVDKTAISGLLLVLAKLVHINSVLHLDALYDRWFVKLLTAAHLLDDASLLGLSFELLESSLNVLTFFYRYDDHCE